MPFDISRVRVEVIEGKQLLACDNGKSSDPYVKIYYPPSAAHSEAKSQPISKTLNPTWNFTHEVGGKID